MNLLMLVPFPNRYSSYSTTMISMVELDNENLIKTSIFEMILSSDADRFVKTLLKKGLTPFSKFFSRNYSTLSLPLKITLSSRVSNTFYKSVSTSNYSV